MNLKEILLSTLTATLETVGESKFIDVLQELHDKNPDQYKAVVIAGHGMVTTLLPFVTKTGTKIDDAILNALGEAIKTSADMNGLKID